jgi:hypothetical protein
MRARSADFVAYGRFARSGRHCAVQRVRSCLRGLPHIPCGGSGQRHCGCSSVTVPRGETAEIDTSTKIPPTTTAHPKRTEAPAAQRLAQGRYRTTIHDSQKDSCSESWNITTSTTDTRLVLDRDDELELSGAPRTASPVGSLATRALLGEPRAPSARKTVQRHGQFASIKLYVNMDKNRNPGRYGQAPNSFNPADSRKARSA